MISIRALFPRHTLLHGFILPAQQGALFMERFMERSMKRDLAGSMPASSRPGARLFADQRRERLFNAPARLLPPRNGLTLFPGREQARHPMGQSAVKALEGSQ